MEPNTSRWTLPDETLAAPHPVAAPIARVGDRELDALRRMAIAQRESAGALPGAQSAAPPPAPPAAPADLSPSAPTDPAARAGDVIALCALAGRPGIAVEFVTARLSLDFVRARLLADQAAAADALVIDTIPAPPVRDHGWGAAVDRVNAQAGLAPTR